MKNNFRAGFAFLLLGVIACEPVFAIGWRELLFVFFLAALVFGPPIYRLLRRIEKYRKSKDK